MESEDQSHANKGISQFEIRFLIPHATESKWSNMNNSKCSSLSRIDEKLLNYQWEKNSSQPSYSNIKSDPNFPEDLNDSIIEDDLPNQAKNKRFDLSFNDTLLSSQNFQIDIDQQHIKLSQNIINYFKVIKANLQKNPDFVQIYVDLVQKLIENEVKEIHYEYFDMIVEKQIQKMIRSDQYNIGQALRYENLVEYLRNYYMDLDNQISVKMHYDIIQKYIQGQTN